MAFHSSSTCPVCASECEDRPLSRHTAAEVAAHFCPKSRSKDRNERLAACVRRLWQSDSCAVLRCAQCGFGFGVPFVGGDEEFYGILHEQRDYPSWRWDYDMAMNHAVSKFSSGKVLDVGAGAGAFLKGLDSKWQRHAVEGSELTRRDLEAEGITVFRDLSAAADAEAGTFDVITLFQVLEHIADFDSLLKQCKRLLRKGGLLVVTVPDGDAMVRQADITGCHDLPPNHINKWTPPSLSLVLRRVGFEPGDSIAEPDSWGQVKTSVHMRVMADATRDHTLAANAYRIQNRSLRILALSSLGLAAFVRMLPNANQLRRGGAFAMVSKSI